MSKTVSLSDAASIVYEGISHSGLPSGAEFSSLSNFFQRLTVSGFGWGSTFRCEMRLHSFYVSLPRLRFGDRVSCVPVLVEVRDASGVRIPGWRLIELYAEYKREREARASKAYDARYGHRRYEFRDGPVPGIYKRRRHKRKNPALRSEMVSNQDIIDDEEGFDQRVSARGKRAPRNLLAAIYDYHGRSRRGNGWKEHRSQQWRS
jgi:hypothetical protein